MKKIELPYHKETNTNLKISELVKEFEYKLSLLKNGQTNNDLIYKELEKVLNDIFIELEELYKNDNIEKEFLKELKNSSKRIFDDDFKFYSSINKKPSNSSFYFQLNLSKISLFLIFTFLKSKIKKLNENLNLNLTTREHLSFNSGIQIFIVTIILNIEFLLKGVFSKIKNFKGVEMNVTGLALELSTSLLGWWKLNNIETPKTTYLHFDETIRNPKAITYLSKVEKSNGPFSVVPKAFDLLNINYVQYLIGRSIGTVGRGNSKIKNNFNHKYHQTFGCKYFKSLFEKLPYDLKFNSHFGFDVKKDSDLEKILIENEIIFTGNIGKTVVFDGSTLLHRGGLVEQGNRLALQIVFGEKEKLYYMKKLLNGIKRKN